MYNIPPLFKDPNIRLELYQMLFEVAKINKELYHKDIHSGNHLPAYLCYRLKDLNHPAVIQLHLARLEPIGHCKAMDPDHRWFEKNTDPILKGICDFVNRKNGGCDDD